MTLQELDDILVRIFGLDFKFEECKKAREDILLSFG